MSNPNYNPQSQHTEQKLRIFSAYLSIYLGILCRRGHSIGIYDMLAGQGIHGDNRGSALLARDAVRDIREQFPNADVRLYLNDKDSEKSQILRESVKNERWVCCTAEDANAVIHRHIAETKHARNLFYLDPFGYSQIKKSTMDEIVRSDKNECLLFVPVSHTAPRFAPNVRKRDERFRSLSDFLTQYNVNVRDYPDAEWSDWGAIIKKGLSDTYSDRFVGFAVLEAEKAVYHALYFISGHPYGLHKFLEAVKSIQDGKTIQLEFGFFVPDNAEIKGKIVRFLAKPKTNGDIYIWGLKEGMLPPQTRAVLLGMEERGEIFVRAEPGRRKGNFYLNKKYPPDKIMVELSGHGN